MIGTESKSIIIKGTTCVIRVGGGFENLVEYITRHQEEELAKIDKMMDDNNKSYVQVIKDLLNKFKAEPAVITKFTKSINRGK